MTMMIFVINVVIYVIIEQDLYKHDGNLKNIICGGEELLSLFSVDGGGSYADLIIKYVSIIYFMIIKIYLFNYSYTCTLSLI